MRTKSQLSEKILCGILSVWSMCAIHHCVDSCLTLRINWAYISICLLFNWPKYCLILKLCNPWGWYYRLFMWWRIINYFVGILKLSYLCRRQLQQAWRIVFYIYEMALPYSRCWRGLHPPIPAEFWWLRNLLAADVNNLDWLSRLLGNALCGVSKGLSWVDNSLASVNS